MAVSFAAYHAHLLRSLTVICPGGIVRSTSQLSFYDRLLYSSGLFPDYVLRWFMRRRLEPKQKAVDVPVEFDDIVLDGGKVRRGEIMKWQLETNEGFVHSYLSTFQNAPIYDQHAGDWKTLSELLSKRRGPTDEASRPPGLSSGRALAILGEKDVYIDNEEWIADAVAVLGEDGVDVHVLEGGHEIAIADGTEVAQLAMMSWTNQR